LVCLVNYKRGLDTVCAIKSLLNIKSPPISIAICDNSPEDESSRAIQDYLLQISSSTPIGDNNKIIVDYAGQEHIYIKSLDNSGFASGNNLCYNAFNSDYPANNFSHYWFLNNDTEVPPDCLSEMLKKFDQPGRKVGMVGSTMVYFHDKKTVQALGGSVYKPWTGTMREIGNGLQWPCPVDEAAVEAQMSYVCGASMLVSADLIRDVGLMQEDYFLFFEEIDWCERARKAGYELAYASQAVVFHKEGAAIGTGTGARRSLLAEYYGMRNKLKVTWRFFPWALPTVWLISWLQVLRRLMQGRPANAWLMARVLLGLGQRPAT